MRKCIIIIFFKCPALIGCHVNVVVAVFVAVQF